MSGGSLKSSASATVPMEGAGAPTAIAPVGAAMAKEHKPHDSHSNGALTADLTSSRFLDLIPRDFAREHMICSQGTNGDRAERLAISPETAPAAVFNVGVRLDCGITTQEHEGELIARVIDEAYGQRTSQNGNGSPSTDFSDIASSEESVEEVAGLLARADRDLLSTSGKAPVVKLVDAILFEALGQESSDVHIQPLSDRTLVRYRVDGVLHDVHELAPALTQAVVSRIKVMGRMDIAERRIPQDGRTTVTIGSRKIDLRISTLPTSYGERAVLRLLDHSQNLCDFDRLGMPAEIAGRFLERARRAHGMILVTGPTGSGKTTTLYSTLRSTASSEVNIMTIEDPIEYELSTVGLAISQAQVNTKKGVTFASGLRHILRQDPDVIMIGEIRDAETARVAIQSSLTGHLVFSTLHTNDAASAATRLIDLGVEPYLVSASLSAVLAQRLVRTIHQECQGTGCAGCYGSGLKGRTGLFELLVMTETIGELVASGAPLSALATEARRNGMSTLREAGEDLIRRDITTVMEVERVVQGVES